MPTVSILCVVELSFEQDPVFFGVCLLLMLRKFENIWIVSAATKKAMHMVRADSKQIVTIFNAAGNKLHEFRVRTLRINL